MVEEHKIYHGKHLLALVFASVFLFSFGILVQNVFADTITGTIPTGNYTAYLAVNPNTNKIYTITDDRHVFPVTTSQLVIIDGSTNSVTKTISYDHIKSGVAVNPNTDKIYVGDRSNGIDVFDGTTDNLVTNIPVNTASIAVNPNTNMIYASNQNGNTVSVIDGSTNSVVTNIAVGSEPDNIAVNQNTNKVYVINLPHNTVSVIDGSTNSVISTIPVEQYPFGIAVNPNINKIYVGNENKDISVIDGVTNTVVSTIQEPYPLGVAVNPNTNKIYATDEFTGLLYVYNGATNNIEYTISVGYGLDAIGVNQNTNKIYVGNGNGLYVIDGNSPPQPPTGLTANAVSPSQINLSWTAPANNGGYAITGYMIERSTDNGSTWSTIQLNTGTTSTTYSDTGLAHSTTYTYGVSAINSVGTGQPSDTSSATTFNTIPTPPTGLTATVQLLKINLNWNAPSDNGGTPITGYMIERSTNGGSVWNTIVANTGNAGTTYSDKNVLPLTTYTYRVSAINNIGIGNPSNTASASITNTPTLP